MEQPKTITITEFGGPLTRRNDGDINSGLAKYESSWGYDPYSKPGNLTWFEQPTSIMNLLGASSIISVMKPRVNSGTGYVHAIASNGNLYNIQVNDPNNNNANYDKPSLVGALPQSPNVLRGAGMVFYGSTEKIFYGDDNGIQKINFDGSGGTSILGTSSLVTSRPRAMINFLGKIYFTNNNNIGEIDSTELMTTGAKLSPALPSGVVATDLDVTPDGNYLQITASRGLINGGFRTVDPTPATATDSFKFLWNGIDDGVTYFEEYGGLRLNSSQTFGDKNYALGYDPHGTAIFSHQQKLVTLPKTNPPHPTATFSTGNTLGFMSTEFADDIYKGSLYHYGQFDSEVTAGLFRLLRQSPAIGTDVAFVNACVPVSNLLYFPSYSNYTNDIASSGKIYFSTLESNGNGNADRPLLWKFTTVPTGVGSIVAGVYETQTQLFSKKVKVSEVRLYTEPLVSGNDFIVEVIGSGGSVMAGGSQRFIVGTSSIAAGTDMVQFNPQMAPTYALGLRITNSSVTGVVNWTATKLEIDYVPGGK